MQSKDFATNGKTLLKTIVFTQKNVRDIYIRGQIRNCL